jgi:hypothetical protein
MVEAWRAWRDGFRAAREADRRRSAARQAAGEDEGGEEEEPDHRRAALVGLVVVAILLALGLYLVDRMRCDPLYSDRALAGSSCR